MKKWLPAEMAPFQLYSLRLLLITGISFCMSLSVDGQTYHTAQETFAVKLGKTKPLHSIYAIPPTDAHKLKTQKLNKPSTVPNFVGRRPRAMHLPTSKPGGADPLWNEWMSRMPLIDVLPTVNFEGITQANSGSVPPDVNGDIGLGYFVEIVNATSFRVYNKSGQAVSLLMNANSIWSQVGQTSSGDPILLYDQEVDRWFLTEFAPVNRRRVLLAISEDGDPRGSWTAYTFQTPAFPDFPKYGIWSNAYYLTTNESGFNFPLYAFNRAQMLAGEDIVAMQRLTVPKIFGAGFEVGQPIDWDGLTPPPPGSPGLVVKLNDDDWGTTPEDVVVLHQITIDWETPANSKVDIINIPTAPFDTDGCNLTSTGGFSCIPQPNGQGIDGAQWIISNKAVYRNFGDHEAFVMCFMVDVTGDDVAGIRWMEFRRTPTEEWHLYQEGTVGSDDGLHRFMGGIAIDGQGSIGLAYSVSGYDKHPSLRYTGRFAYDPPGEMTWKEYEFATGGSSQGQDRFGDYSSMSVDPANESTFWFAGQYLPAGGDWSTKIVAFSASRDSNDIAPIQLIAPLNADTLGTDEQVTVEIRNQGLRTVFDFTVSYQFENGDWIEEPANLDSLVSNGSYQHHFIPAISFDQIGAYTMKVATSLPGDNNIINDTAEFLIYKYPHLDAGLEYVNPVLQTILCNDEGEATVIIRNLGGDTIYNVLLEVLVNGEMPRTIPWSGALAFGEETEVSFVVTGLGPGTNTISMTVININNNLDEVPDNNHVEWTTEAIPDGQEVTLTFRTDNFPAESTWKLFDMTGNELFSDGPFALTQHEYVTSFCLDPEACYTFSVYDSFGDGMNQGIPKGDFEIRNSDNVLLAKMARPNFGSQTSSTFCVTGNCMMEISAASVPVSAADLSDGVIIITPVNNLGNVMYSIDGGQQFSGSSVLDSLATGIYTVIAVDQALCRDTFEVAVGTCTIQAIVSTTPAIGGDVGTITVTVTGATGPLSFSLNGGVAVGDSVFTMLEPGDYVVQIMDSLGCLIVQEVTVSTDVSTGTISDQFFIRVSPNPGQGVFTIMAQIPSAQIFVPYMVITQDGQIIHHGSLVRYGHSYHDELLLTTVPAGVYYVLLSNHDTSYAARIVKQ